MKKLLLLALAAIVFAACQESLEERAKREAKTYTEKTCPYRLDDLTTLDSVTFDTGSHVFVNYYTLSGAADHAFSADERVRSAQGLKTMLQGDTKQQVYKDAGYSYRYVYRSKAHPQEVLFEVTLTAADYR